MVDQGFAKVEEQFARSGPAWLLHGIAFSTITALPEGHRYGEPVPRPVRVKPDREGLAHEHGYWGGGTAKSLVFPAVPSARPCVWLVHWLAAKGS